MTLLHEAILPNTQYYAYIEIADEHADRASPSIGKDLWKGYNELASGSPNFEIKHVAGRGDIYPVFRELFTRHRKGATT